MINMNTDAVVENGELSFDRTAGFGRQLRMLRKRKKITERVVAEAMGIAPSGVHAIEVGRQAMSTMQLLKYIDALGLVMEVTFKDAN